MNLAAVLSVIIALYLGIWGVALLHNRAYDKGRAHGQQEILNDWTESEARLHRQYPRGFCQ